MVQIRKIGIGEWQSVQQIAYQTWPHTYGSYLTSGQIAWLLGSVYSERSLEQQMFEQQNHFLLAENEGQASGFVSYENNYEGLPQLMIHKLYLLSASQGLGIGTQIIAWLVEGARAANFKRILLKVFCKNSKAIRFYEKQGFIRIGTVEKKVGDNHTVLDDIMAKDV